MAIQARPTRSELSKQRKKNRTSSSSSRSSKRIYKCVSFVPVVGNGFHPEALAVVLIGALQLQISMSLEPDDNIRMVRQRGMRCIVPPRRCFLMHGCASNT
nr:uncharacterized protein LOC115263791 [Aedes albopictus]